MLINHVRGPLSFDHLRIVGGVFAPTFSKTAMMLGLLEIYNNLEDSLTEASLYKMPHTLRRLVVKILIYCNLTSLREH